MTIENEEPAPPKNESDGTQRQESPANSVVEVLTPVKSNIGSTAFQDAIDKIAQAHPRGLGGEIGAALISAATRHLTTEIREQKIELHDAHLQIDKLKDQLAKKDVTVAVQGERINNLSRGRHFRYLLVTFGTALVGFSIEFFRNQMVEFGASCALMGAVIIIGTWLSSPKGGGQ